MEKLDGKSMDIVQQNIEQLKALFPEVFSEGKLKFNQLQELLGNYVVENEDPYNFTWHGKRKAGRLAQTPSTGTLRPCKEESVDWDTTQNLFIEGDNLEVLKLLQKSYHRQVKMIYIDPPYNTGNDFVYEDDFKDGVKNYLEMTAQLDSDGKKVGTNSSSAGRYHTNWLNMMYPRLKLARNLLHDDGVIFISIDDNEQANLKKICDEVFGEENFIGCITRVSKTTSFRGNFIAPGKDYILCYSKDLEKTNRFVDEVDESQFKKIEVAGDRKGEQYRDDIAFYLSTLETRPNQRYFIESPDGSKVIPPGETFPPEKPKSGDGVWRWNLDSFNEKKELIVFKKSNQSPLLDEHGKKAKWNLYTKSYLKEKLEKGNLPRDLWCDFLNRAGTSELKKLDIPFSFPKPSSLILKMLNIIQTEPCDVVLDFFAGSCSAAHAALSRSAELNGSLHYIMVQLPEKVDEASDAKKMGYTTIADIGKERIRRAAKKIKEEQLSMVNDKLLMLEKKRSAGEDVTELQQEIDHLQLTINNSDFGFKVFKLDSSNIKRWEADFDTLKQDLYTAVDYIKQDRSSEDILYELLLKYGLDLTVPIETRSIAGKTVYSIGLGALVVCLEKDVSMDVVNGIGALKEELQPEIMRVVFKDDGFKDDVVKTNAMQTLKRYGIEDIKSL